MRTQEGHEQEIELRGQKVRARIVVEQPGERRRTVAGFPFSLIEMLLTSIFDGIERVVEQLVRRAEQRLTQRKGR